MYMEIARGLVVQASKYVQVVELLRCEKYRSKFPYVYHPREQS